MDINNTPTVAEDTGIIGSTSRRDFFRLAGGLAGAGLFIASCRRTPSSTTFLGEGDVALLNYLYVLKQVTSAFYTQAVATPYYGISKSESDLQPDLRDQEIAHREYFKALLGKNAIKEIKTQLSAVTFIDKKSFLTHATTLEDLSVGAYNGCVKVFKSTDYMLAVSRISSVDARHAGYVRDILTHGSFADVTDNNGLDKVIAPVTGMTMLENYIETKFDRSKLPTF